jgi:hypothetical protein
MRTIFRTISISIVIAAIFHACAGGSEPAAALGQTGPRPA